MARSAPTSSHSGITAKMKRYSLCACAECMSTITTKTEAAGLLRAHLPEAVSRELVWSSLEVQRGSFIDDRLRDSESDLPYAVRRTADGGAAWLGRLEGQIGAIENLLRAGAPWPLIESATGIDQAALRALKRRLETSSTTTEPTEGSANGAEDTE